MDSSSNCFAISSSISWKAFCILNGSPPEKGHLLVHLDHRSSSDRVFHLLIFSVSSKESNRRRRARLNVKNADCPNSEQLYVPLPVFVRNPPSLSFREFSHTVFGFKSSSFMKSAKFIVLSFSSTTRLIIFSRVWLDSASNMLENRWKSSSNAWNSRSSWSFGQSVGDRGTSRTTFPSRTS